MSLRAICAQVIAERTRTLGSSIALAQFIFISSPVRENSVSQIPYTLASDPEDTMSAKCDGPHTDLDTEALRYLLV